MLCWCAVVVVIVCYGVMCLDSKQLIGLDTEGCFVSCVLSPCSLSLSLCIFCLSIVSTFILSSSVMLCDLLCHVLHWNTDELSTHTRLSDTRRTVQAASSIVYSVFSSVIAFFFSLPSPCLRTNHIQPQDLLPGCMMGPQSLIVLFTSTVARVISNAEQKTWWALIHLIPIPKGIIKV